MDSIDRKARTEAYLRARGIPVAPGLPPSMGEAEVPLRTARTVAERAVALFAVAACAEGLGQKAAIQFLEARSLWAAATREEQTFLLDPAPPEQENLQFVWRYESLWVLLWSLGQIETLNFPDRICNIDRITQVVLYAPIPQWLEVACLRPTAEILDQADLIYRCHRAITEARVEGNPVSSLDAGVVYERRYAFNWLTHRLDQDWDDVSTDT